MKQDKCIALVERDKKVIAKTQHLSYFPLVVESAHGSKVVDADGNEFIDFLTSASSLNLGSSHPVITAAIEAQLKKCTQYTAAYTYNQPLIEYAERLTSVYPGGVDAQIVFGNCGSDGNDAAIKFARAYTGRTKIISFINGYHGNTYGSSSLTTVTTRMHQKMGPFLPDIYHFPFFGSEVDDVTCEAECVAEIDKAFRTYLPAEEVAAVIIEPVQGDGGMLPAHPIFMEKLFRLCAEHGILFISEEVQQAFFRTGRWFSIEHYDIVPDGIILGKSLGAGLTLGAFMARREIMETLPAPAHLFTLGGNAIACAAGVAAFDLYQDPTTQQRIQDNIALLNKLTDGLMKKHGDLVGVVRRLGLSCGISILKKQAGGERMPDLDGTFKILYRSYELGLLIISIADNVLRIQPPVIMEPELMKKGFDILDHAMCDYVDGLIPDDVLKYRQGW